MFYSLLLNYKYVKNKNVVKKVLKTQKCNKYYFK